MVLLHSILRVGGLEGCCKAGDGDQDLTLLRRELMIESGSDFGSDVVESFEHVIAPDD